MTNGHCESDEQGGTAEACPVRVSGAEDHSDQHEGEDELHTETLGLGHSVTQGRHRQVFVLGGQGQPGGIERGEWGRGRERGEREREKGEGGEGGREGREEGERERERKRERERERERDRQREREREMRG